MIFLYTPLHTYTRIGREIHPSPSHTNAHISISLYHASPIQYISPHRCISPIHLYAMHAFLSMNSIVSSYTRLYAYTTRLYAYTPIPHSTTLMSHFSHTAIISTIRSTDKRICFVTATDRMSFTTTTDRMSFTTDRMRFIVKVAKL